MPAGVIPRHFQTRPMPEKIQGRGVALHKSRPDTEDDRILSDQTGLIHTWL